MQSKEKLLEIFCKAKCPLSYVLDFNHRPLCMRASSFDMVWKCAVLKDRGYSYCELILDFAWKLVLNSP